MVKYLSELTAKERTYDYRRSLMTTQTVGICSRHNACLEQTVMLIHTHQSLNHEGDETQVTNIILARTMQQDACISGKRPVVVLARTIDTVERLFM